MPTLDTRLDWEAIEAVASGQAATAQAAPRPDPKARLWDLLDIWTQMDEDQWTQEAVDGLKDEILDVFKMYPEADAWYREWRQAHPAAKLA